MGRELCGETVDVFGSGNKGDTVTLLSNEFGELKKRDHMPKGEPWEHYNVELLVVGHGGNVKSVGCRRKSMLKTKKDASGVGV